MADREKLIERFAERLKEAYPQSDRNNPDPAIYYDDFCDIVDEVAAKITDSIAHGVTVQGDKDINVPTKWISVKDRLPTIYDADADNCVLAIHKASNKRY